MASQELLLMLVVEVFDDKKASNVVDHIVFFDRMEMDSVLMLTVVADGMLEF